MTARLGGVDRLRLAGAVDFTRLTRTSDRTSSSLVIECHPSTPRWRAIVANALRERDLSASEVMDYNSGRIPMEQSDSQGSFRSRP